MGRIVIEVDETVAKKWRLSSQERRDRISQQINLTIARELADSKEDFIQCLNEVRSKMKERGLTEALIQKILSKNNREASFEELLEEARKEVGENGLTEEILERLLNNR